LLHSLLYSRTVAVSADLIAAAVLTLLFAAVHNAWDMVWIEIKTPSLDFITGGYTSSSSRKINARTAGVVEVTSPLERPALMSLGGHRIAHCCSCLSP
jgi:hypothetical protein